MSNFSWENEDEFRDVPDEVNGQTPDEPEFLEKPKYRPKGQQLVPKQDVIEETEEFVEQEQEEDEFADVLSDARLRLEQGRLYEMIMRHDLFQGVDADPRAITFVQKQIRNFAKESMEVMLGMRQTTPVRAEVAAVEPEFNEIEVNVLKKLASTATKGISEKAAPVKTSNGLSPIRGPVKKAQPSRPVEPISRQKPVQKPQPSTKSTGEYKPLDKSPSEMTEEELLAHNQQVAERQKNKRAYSSNAMPPATFEQQQFLAMEKAASPPTVAAQILSVINKQ